MVTGDIVEVAWLDLELTDNAIEEMVEFVSLSELFSAISESSSSLEDSSKRSLSSCRMN